MTYSKALEIHSDIFDTNDGPVTEFSAMYKAVQLAASKEYDCEDIANVLYEGLKDFKELPSTEFNYSY